MMHPPHMDLDDKVLHYLLIGVGIAGGSFVKALWDKLAEKFWDKEWAEFRKFKATLKDKKE
jgi:hypothetical protein